jgi:drug/metabolite transporter (DMT)-like permease
LSVNGQSSGSNITMTDVPTSLMARMRAHALHHWLLLGILVSIWGCAFLLIKTSLESLPPQAIVFSRLLVGFLVLVPLLAALRPSLPLTRQFAVLVLVMALTGNVVPFLLIAWGQEVVPSASTGILMAVMPLTIIVLAHIFVVEEPLNARKLTGFGLGFVGIVVLMGPGALKALAGDMRTLTHELAILGGAILYAANVIITRRLPSVHPLAVSGAVMFVGLCLATPTGLPATVSALDAASLRSLVAVLLLGMFPTGLATVLYYELIRRAGASFYAITNYLVPVMATVVGATLGRERLGLNVFIALALILLGIAVSRMTRKQARGAMQSS